MNFVPPRRRIFAYSAPVDMRKGYVGLESLILHKLDRDPLSGDAFVFINKDGKLLKCFLWDRTGYVIISKRLERGKFRLRGDGQIELDDKRLHLLLDGMPVGGITADD